MSSITTALAWVPQGAAAQFPTRYEFEDGDYERIVKTGRLQLDQAKQGLQDAQEAEKAEFSDSAEEATDGVAKMEVDEGDGGSDDDLAEYNLDTYDESEKGSDEEQTSVFNNIQSLVYHQPDEADPYITMKDIPDNEDDEERAELQIMATDNLILSAKIEDEVAHLEIYVYEDEVDNLYVHHDIMLPDIPLCLEWLDFPVGNTASDPNQAGNFVAVGTMSPDIEIWNLDMVDSILPDAILGQGSSDPSDNTGSRPAPSKKKSSKKRKRISTTHHVDAVLALAANKQHRNLLASSSADTTIKLWNLPTQKCAQSYTYHGGKVSAIAWNPKDAPILLSGSYDHSVAVADVRAPNAEPLRAKTTSDVEGVLWDPHESNCFYVSTESGTLLHYDLRTLSSSPSTSKPLWTLQAHDESITAFDASPSIPGLLATGSNDKKVKLWDVKSGTGPSLVVARDLQVGKVFSAKFGPDAGMGFRLVVGGSSGGVQVWDTGSNLGVRRAFGRERRVKREQEEGEGKGVDEEDEGEEGDGEERIVGVEMDRDEDEEDDEEESRRREVIIRDGPEAMEEDSSENEEEWVDDQAAAVEDEVPKKVRR